MASTMRAAVLDAPGLVTNFRVTDLPIPVPQPGWVRVKVKAFGLNRSELLTRQGHSGDAVTFPRVLGIEATGVVDEDPSGTFEVGQKVMTMMGGMIRGGTSYVGMAAAILAKRLGMTVFSTTRSPEKSDALERIGVDHVIVDEGAVARSVRAILPEGVNGAIELVGTPTLRDTLRAVRVHGVVCFTGMLSGQWIVKDFYPIDSIYALDQIRDAHLRMESGAAAGKIVVVNEGEGR